MIANAKTTKNFTAQNFCEERKMEIDDELHSEVKTETSKIVVELLEGLEAKNFSKRDLEILENSVYRRELAWIGYVKENFLVESNGESLGTKLNLEHNIHQDQQTLHYLEKKSKVFNLEIEIKLETAKIVVELLGNLEADVYSENDIKLLVDLVFR